MRKGDEKRGKGGMRPIASLFFSRIAELIGGGRNEKRERKKSFGGVTRNLIVSRWRSFGGY